jgi:membrane dipeptidase
VGIERVKIATKYEDIIKAWGGGCKSIVLGLQDQPIGSDLRLLETLKLCRVRIFQLSYNYRNLIADGADERTDGGLSKFGVQVVEELNRLGMMVDLSHVGVASTMDAMEISKDPVVFSHVGVKALNNHFRCINDEQIKALAEKRGMIGILALNGFIVPNGYEVGTTIDDYLKHIDYVAELVGVDYVGVGSDIRTQEKASSFTHQKATGRLAKGIVRKDLQRKPPAWASLTTESKYPKGMTNVGEFGNIVRGLVSRGYSDQDIAKILGENFLRVFKQVCG